jgi:hypothetical protein
MYMYCPLAPNEYKLLIHNSSYDGVKEEVLAKLVLLSLTVCVRVVFMREERQESSVRFQSEREFRGGRRWGCEMHPQHKAGTIV